MTIIEGESFVKQKTRSFFIIDKFYMTDIKLNPVKRERHDRKE